MVTDFLKHNITDILDIVSFILVAPQIFSNSILNWLKDKKELIKNLSTSFRHNYKGWILKLFNNFDEIIDTIKGIALSLTLLTISLGFYIPFFLEPHIPEGVIIIGNLYKFSYIIGFSILGIIIIGFLVRILLGKSEGIIDSVLFILSFIPTIIIGGIFFIGSFIASLLLLILFFALASLLYIFLLIIIYPWEVILSYNIQRTLAIIGLIVFIISRIIAKTLV